MRIKMRNRRQGRLRGALRSLRLRGRGPLPGTRWSFSNRRTSRTTRR